MQYFYQKYKGAQIAIEYLILLGVVTAVVLIGFSAFLRETQGVTNSVVNQTFRGLMGGNTVYQSRAYLPANAYP